METKIDLEGKWFVVSKFYDDGQFSSCVKDYYGLLDLFGCEVVPFVSNCTSNAFFIRMINYDLYINVFDSREEAVAFLRETVDA